VRFDKDGVRTTTSGGLGSDGVRNCGVTAIAAYVLFAGGRISLFSGASNQVSAINEAGTRTGVSGLSSSKYNVAGASAGGFAFFGFGEDVSGNRKSDIDIYNASLSKVATQSGQARTRAMAAQNGDDAVIFAGGTNADMDSYYSNVERITTSGVKQNISPLSEARYGGGAQFLSGVVPVTVFFGGTKSGGYSNKIDAYTTTGVKVTCESTLTNGRGWIDNLTGMLGGKIFIVGGAIGGNVTDTVEILTQI